MDPQDVIDIGREAIFITLMVSAPMLIVGMAVGLFIGLVQALTQIQEQTIAFVPKIVAMILALLIAMPWILNKMIEYSTDLITNIPETF